MKIQLGFNTVNGKGCCNLKERALILMETIVSIP